MTNPESTDYAALIRAVTPNSERKHPEWLDTGQQLFSPKYGQGEVMSWMGNTLIVKFPGYSVPVLYKDWQQAVERSEIAPGEASKTPESSSESEENGAGEIQSASFSQVSAAFIAAIPQPKFRAITLILAVKSRRSRLYSSYICAKGCPQWMKTVPKPISILLNLC